MSHIEIQLPVQIMCPHLQKQKKDLAELLMVEDISNTFSCFCCQQDFQLFICMDCLDVYCVHHRASHTHQARYLDISENSFWCAQCSYLQIISNIKLGVYTRVVFLTGAGLSVAAGIPDFRTPGTGLYYQLSKYNLPSPQDVFDINYFAQNPLPFIKLTKQWANGNFQPTKGHKFIKRFFDTNMLSCCITQNIDGLEEKVGIPNEYLIEAHGSSKTVSCIKCKLPGVLQQWNQSVQKQEVTLCQNCWGYIKTDITFFGESLPKKFFKSFELVQSADLVFVIGTSLKVQPFCQLINQISFDTPVILINNTDSLPYLGRKVWLNRSIQQQILAICSDLGWNLE